VQWRQFDSVMAAYWEAEGDVGGTGHYVSANPRISVFFTDVSSIRIAVSGTSEQARPMARVFYVPAGMPMRTAFTAPLSFSHLDVHFELGKAVHLLAPVIGRNAARSLLARPAELEEAGDLEMLARLLVDEVRRPTRHCLFSERLADSLIAAVLDIRAPGEMAEAVNLSESWFHQVFKTTTGLTPLRWQMKQRIGMAQRLLADPDLTIADVADRLGFADQSHLTKIFRQAEGQTPAAWRRALKRG
jgi:AraC-like DNA-binding protein